MAVTGNDWVHVQHCCIQWPVVVTVGPSSAFFFWRVNGVVLVLSSPFKLLAPKYIMHALIIGVESYALRAEDPVNGLPSSLSEGGESVSGYRLPGNLLQKLRHIPLSSSASSHGGTEGTRGL